MKRKFQESSATLKKVKLQKIFQPILDMKHIKNGDVHKKNYKKIQYFKGEISKI